MAQELGHEISKFVSRKTRNNLRQDDQLANPHSKGTKGALLANKLN